MRKLIRFVTSVSNCEYHGCTNKCCIIDAMISNGRRCLEHAPAAWINEAEMHVEVEYYIHKPHSTFTELMERGKNLSQKAIDDILNTMI